MGTQEHHNSGTPGPVTLVWRDPLVERSLGLPSPSPFLLPETPVLQEGNNSPVLGLWSPGTQRAGSVMFSRQANPIQDHPGNETRVRFRFHTPTADPLGPSGSRRVRGPGSPGSGLSGRRSERVDSTPPPTFEIGIRLFLHRTFRLRRNYQSLPRPSVVPTTSWSDPRTQGQKTGPGRLVGGGGSPVLDDGVGVRPVVCGHGRLRRVGGLSVRVSRTGTPGRHTPREPPRTGDAGVYWRNGRSTRSVVPGATVACGSSAPVRPRVRTRRRRYVRSGPGGAVGRGHGHGCRCFSGRLDVGEGGPRSDWATVTTPTVVSLVSDGRVVTNSELPNG